MAAGPPTEPGRLAMVPGDSVFDPPGADGRYLRMSRPSSMVAPDDQETGMSRSDPIPPSAAPEEAPATRTLGRKS